MRCWGVECQEKLSGDNQWIEFSFSLKCVWRGTLDLLTCTFVDFKVQSYSNCIFKNPKDLFLQICKFEMLLLSLPSCFYAYLMVAWILSNSSIRGSCYPSAALQHHFFFIWVGVVAEGLCRDLHLSHTAIQVTFSSHLTFAQLLCCSCKVQPVCISHAEPKWAFVMFGD